MLCLCGAIGVAGFSALGIWQLERRVWKLDLIDRVEHRLQAAPVAAPGPDAWATVSAADDEYRRLAVPGRFVDDRETLVQAVTDLGGGFWVMAPFRTDAGFIVLVNRGFVPADKRDPTARPMARVSSDLTVLHGLLRMTEPKGGFLRANDAAANRWYSRDIQAIAAAQGIAQVAPYFIDADATPNPGGWPVGGLTVVSFHNSHLVYAVTWFGLALMMLGAVAYLLRQATRSSGRD
ncbi:SURF1 family protein [Mesorhizobium sp. INR15]|uniref:SURF1 family protein n=1 Tax=Mesorhizobium sp. INR15 TaxID=2654248 RepID=UPI0018964000|nr:SURF1 family protein [Mesorhizobium sp. INR15]